MLQKSIGSDLVVFGASGTLGPQISVDATLGSAIVLLIELQSTTAVLTVSKFLAGQTFDVLLLIHPFQSAGIVLNIDPPFKVQHSALSLSNFSAPSYLMLSFRAGNDFVYQTSIASKNMTVETEA